MWLCQGDHQSKIPIDSCRALKWCWTQMRQSSMEAWHCVKAERQLRHSRAQWEPIPQERWLEEDWQLWIVVDRYPLPGVPVEDLALCSMSYRWVEMAFQRLLTCAVATSKGRCLEIHLCCSHYQVSWGCQQWRVLDLDSANHLLLRSQHLRHSSKEHFGHLVAFRFGTFAMLLILWRWMVHCYISLQVYHYWDLRDFL